MSTSARLVLVLLLLSAFAFAQAPAAGAEGSLPALPKYPNTAAGLESFLADAIRATLDGKTSLVRAYSRSLVLPAAEAWFSARFGNANCDAVPLPEGDCFGPRLAAAYAAYSGVLPASFEMTLQDINSEKLMTIEAVDSSLPCAGPLTIRPVQGLVGGLTTTPLVSPVFSGILKEHEPIYAVWLYSVSKMTTLAYFTYAEGGFRYLGMPHQVSAEEWVRLRAANSTPRSAMPHYLTNNQAEANGFLVDLEQIKSTVVVSVKVDKQGTPEKVEYVRGSEALRDEALAAVRRRHFEAPGTGPRGVHPASYCINWTPAQH